MGEYFGPFDIRVLGLLGWHPGSRVELWVLEDVSPWVLYDVSSLLPFGSGHFQGYLSNLGLQGAASPSQGQFRRKECYGCLRPL